MQSQAGEMQGILSSKSQATAALQKDVQRRDSEINLLKAKVGVEYVYFVCGVVYSYFIYLSDISPPLSLSLSLSLPLSLSLSLSHFDNLRWAP